MTDEFIKVYLARPELVPPVEACVRRAGRCTEHCWQNRVGRCPPGEIDVIADADARENWRTLLDFRDHLLSHRTLEAAYIDVVRRGLRIPHLFLNQIVHVILRNALDGCDDATVLRGRRTVLPAAAHHAA